MFFHTGNVINMAVKAILLRSNTITTSLFYHPVLSCEKQDGQAYDTKSHLKNLFFHKGMACSARPFTTLDQVAALRQ